MRQAQNEWNQKNCLMSVSKTAQNIMMWAHYADRYKGAVIGIDFDNIFYGTNILPGIRMYPVKFSNLDILENMMGVFEIIQKELPQSPL